MTIYAVTTSNWNDPAFWASINETGSGHTLDFSGLPSDYSIDLDLDVPPLTISDGSTSFVVGDASYGGAQNASLGGSTLFNAFTTIIGTEGGDFEWGGSADETLSGAGGDDTLRGWQGNDSISGGDGNDLIAGEYGDDTIDGGAGSDTVMATNASGADQVVGGESTDDQDVLDLLGSTGASVTFSGDEAGSYTIGSASGTFSAFEEVRGSDGNDTIDASATSSGMVLNGEGGADSVIGGEGSDTLLGGDGDDTLLGGAGDDTIEGGSGNDLLYGDAGGGGITLSIGGTDRNGVPPEFEVYADGVLIYTGSVTWAQDGANTFDPNLPGAFQEVVIPVSGGLPDSVAVTFINDWVDGDESAPGEDRNVHLDSVTVGETLFEAETASVISNGGAAAGTDVNLWGTGSTATFDTSSAIDTVGNDTLAGGSGADTLYGGDGNNHLFGGADNDSLVGTATNPGGFTQMDGGAGADTLDGSVGNWDIASYYTSSSAVDVDLSDGSSETGGDATGDVLVGMEQIDGSTFDDTIVADDSGMELKGWDGNDTITGGAGEDTILGGDGNDSLSGGAGADFLKTGQGQDTLDGGDGDDTLMNAAGDDSLIGGSGDDLIVATQGQDTLEGGTGSDTLMGGVDDDSLDGGDGNDLLLGDLAGVTFNETANDGVALAPNVDDFPQTQITVEITFSGTDIVDLPALFSYATDTEDDAFRVSSHSGSIRVEIDGRIYNTRVPESSLFDGEVHTLGVTWDSASGAIEVYVDGSVEHSGTHQAGATVEPGGTVAFAQDQDDVGGGFVANQAFTGTIYGVRLYDDVRSPDEMRDSALGPAADTSDSNLIANWVADPDAASFTDLTGSHPMTTSGNVASTWSSGNDTLQGGDGDDTVYGGGGDDTVQGGTGADWLSGGDDADTFIIEDGFGNDTIEGGEGGIDSDVIDLSALSGPVTVSYDGDATGTITDGTHTITFSQVERIIGTEHGDVFDASADTAGVEFVSGGGDDTITGGSGADTIDGGDGSDVIAGGAGDDNLTTGAGDDTVVLSNGAGADTVTDFDTGDDNSDGAYNDQFDVSGMTNDDGLGLKSSDVSTVDDGAGNARLQFPASTSSSSMTMQSTPSSSMDESAEYRAAGIPCFAAGTLISTPQGEVPVELIRPGDLVLTRDNGPRPVIWAKMRALMPKDFGLAAHLKPVRIEAGAFGEHGRLLVSPQHGLLLRQDGEETLVRAKHLARLKGGKARVMAGCRRVVYCHLLLERHEVLFSNGLASESYFPGPEAIRGLDPFVRETLTETLPQLATIRRRKDAEQIYGAPARGYALWKDMPHHLNAFDAAK